MHDNHVLTSHILTVFFGYFAIMNPLANTAVFVGLTDGMNSKQRRHIALKSLLITLIIIALFAAFGKTLFHFFGITLPALQVTGGVIVFIIGYQMLHGEGSKLHSPTTSDDDNIAVSPLAVPLLAGPGTIATTMNYTASGGWLNIIVTIGVFAFLCLITLLCFLAGQKLVSFIGESMLAIITRLMGLILAVIGSQMFIEGVSGAVKTFSH